MDRLPSVSLSVENDELGKVCIIDLDGEPWILAKTICETLGYKNIYAMLSRYVSKENKKKVIVDELVDKYGAHAPSLFVNKGGLGQILMHARLKPKAVRMKEWIFGSLLGQRKQGSSAAPAVVQRQIVALDPSYGEALKKLHNNQCVLYQQNMELSKTLKSVCSMVSELLSVLRIDGMNWRDAANTIARNGGKGQIQERFHEMYRMLEQATHVNLKVRKSNLQKQHPTKKITTLDAIAEDRQLIECFITILRRYALTHGLDVKINELTKGAA